MTRFPARGVGVVRIFVRGKAVAVHVVDLGLADPGWFSRADVLVLAATGPPVAAPAEAALAAWPGAVAAAARFPRGLRWSVRRLAGFAAEPASFLAILRSGLAGTVAGFDIGESGEDFGAIMR
ncbi:hypothetical protein ATK36_1435 [Amycolatopsis sulphurea]|uniref:Uncharacterized protein n=1 Tax=Amycolatopsis sulphurea TaxID=76022 RepID=A0A2A9F5L7_9PSEU|nr:hypothetical protein ATK36_1435 [Amycolatopsis sulphurea]